MEFDAVLLPPRRAASIAAGLWRDRTINDEIDACVATCPDKTALTAVRLETGTVRRFGYRELAMLADRVAVGVTVRGNEERSRGGGELGRLGGCHLMADNKPTSAFYNLLGGINQKASEYAVGRAQFLDIRNMDFDVPR